MAQSVSAFLQEVPSSIPGSHMVGFGFLPLCVAEVALDTRKTEHK